MVKCTTETHTVCKLENDVAALPLMILLSLVQTSLKGYPLSAIPTCHRNPIRGTTQPFHRSQCQQRLLWL